MPSLSQLITADYKTIKTAESEKIIAQSLKNLMSVEKPELRQISGIPGAGKSTFCKSHLPYNFLLLSFDKIMSSLSGYKRLLKEKGAEEAYKKYEMPARIIGYEILRRAINHHFNIMFEHSGTNPAHLEMFKNLPKRGYKTSVDFIICDTSLAIKRSKIRAQKINRYVPESLIFERANGFEEYIKAYKKLTTQVTCFDGANNFSLIK